MSAIATLLLRPCRDAGVLHAALFVADGLSDPPDEPVIRVVLRPPPPSLELETIVDDLPPSPPPVRSRCR